MDIQQMADEFLRKGMEILAQDLYILPKGDVYECFYRKSTELFERTTLDKEVASKLILHFKFRSGMNIGEKRRAQLGSFTFTTNGEKARARLSTVGNFLQKESLVLRFLGKLENNALHYFFPEQLTKISELVKKRGLTIFSGATGNGKTTTMYTIAKRQQNNQQIIAIEDPVEIEEEQMLQLQVNQEIGMDYDSLIKLCLRHRPDLLIVGEIRDSLTAKSVIRASLTGHTVMSTIHARNIQGVKERLRDLGVNEQELSECLSGIIYQRILPTNNGKFAVLFDIWKFQKGGGSSGEWNNYLQTLKDKKIISEETYAQEYMEP